MRLQEKFSVLNCADCDMPYCEIKCTYLSERELNILSEIADDFAIGFNDWVNMNVYKYPTKITTKELLEIYKKEKQL